jgi:phosphoribosylamine--glycine ligase
MSYFAFVDGAEVVPLACACDYKRVYDNDEGPNTGGMGSYTPPFFTSQELEQQILENIVRPTAEAMVAEDRPYQGMLYTGLMITPQGPKVLEFNARFGDPETQVILPLLESDLFDIFYAVARGMLKDVFIQVSQDACVGVIMAAKNYPADPEKGQIIAGMDQVDYDINIFQAGTKEHNGQILTNGGRVLIVCARELSLKKAREKVYANIQKIYFEGAHYRTDIALISNKQEFRNG